MTQPAPHPLAAPSLWPLLEIQHLDVAFPQGHGWLPVVRDVSLTVRRGETLGLVGESGSGKTLTALSVLRLVPPQARVGGSIRLGGEDLLALPEPALRQVRGGRIGVIFQEPMTALNPLYTIGFQIAEAVRAHRRASRREALAEAVRLLDLVALPDARRRLGDYPHQLSGGQRQRVMIAMALASRPDLLLADEPTTALDVTLQAQILELLQRLQRELGLAVLLITHDLAVVAETCDRVAVMSAGRLVEEADAVTLFRAPAHPYTRALLAAVPRLGRLAAGGALPGAGGTGERGGAAASALVEIEGLRKEYPVRRGLFQRRLGTVRALDGVDLAVRRGECLALVGESGSGKTTLGRCMVRLVEPTAGRVRFDGEDLTALGPRDLRRRRRRFQMVFQDPYGSLDPRQRIGEIVAEPLAVHGGPDPEERRRQRHRRHRRHRVEELLDQVGLPAAMADRFPHELSGGQRQRVGIARALAPGPDLLVADEPISALDVSVRAQILSLLAGLRGRLGLTLVLIAHDLAAVEQVADRVAVMYLGRVVELGARAAVFARPLHPYTVSLLSAVPVPEPGRRRDRIVLAGEPPSPLAPPPGCPFHTRCPIARPRCAIEAPPLAVLETLKDTGEPHLAACFYPGELQPRREEGQSA